jgi:hypothetical protein
LRHGNLSVSKASAGQAITLAGRVCTKKCISLVGAPTAPSGARRHCNGDAIPDYFPRCHTDASPWQSALLAGLVLDEPARAFDLAADLAASRLR